MGKRDACHRSRLSPTGERRCHALLTAPDGNQKTQKACWLAAWQAGWLAGSLVVASNLAGLLPQHLWFGYPFVLPLGTVSLKSLLLYPPAEARRKAAILRRSVGAMIVVAIIGSSLIGWNVALVTLFHIFHNFCCVYHGRTTVSRTDDGRRGDVYTTSGPSFYLRNETAPTTHRTTQGINHVYVQYDMISTYATRKTNPPCPNHLEKYKKIQPVRTHVHVSENMTCQSCEGRLCQRSTEGRWRWQARGSRSIDHCAGEDRGRWQTIGRSTCPSAGRIGSGGGPKQVNHHTTRRGSGR